MRNTKFDNLLRLLFENRFLSKNEWKEKCNEGHLSQKFWRYRHIIYSWFILYSEIKDVLKKNKSFQDFSCDELINNEVYFEILKLEDYKDLKQIMKRQALQIDKQLCWSVWLFFTVLFCVILHHGITQIITFQQTIVLSFFDVFFAIIIDNVLKKWKTSCVSWQTLSAYKLFRNSLINGVHYPIVQNPVNEIDTIEASFAKKDVYSDAIEWLKKQKGYIDFWNKSNDLKFNEVLKSLSLSFETENDKEVINYNNLSKEEKDIIFTMPKRIETILLNNIGLYRIEHSTGYTFFVIRTSLTDVLTNMFEFLRNNNLLSVIYSCKESTNFMHSNLLKFIRTKDFTFSSSLDSGLIDNKKMINAKYKVSRAYEIDENTSKTTFEKIENLKNVNSLAASFLFNDDFFDDYNLKYPSRNAKMIK